MYCDQLTSVMDVSCWSLVRPGDLEELELHMRTNNVDMVLMEAETDTRLEYFISTT